MDDQNRNEPSARHVTGFSLMGHCKACRTQWEIPISLPMPIRDAGKVMDGHSICPSCAGMGLCGPLDASIPSIRSAAQAMIDANVFLVTADEDIITDDEVNDLWNNFCAALQSSPAPSIAPATDENKP